LRSAITGRELAGKRGTLLQKDEKEKGGKGGALKERSTGGQKNQGVGVLAGCDREESWGSHAQPLKTKR